MQFVMKDWIRTGIWNKPAWDYVLEDVELSCGVTFSFLWSTSCCSGLSPWAGALAHSGAGASKAQGPCREEVLGRILQCPVTACKPAACWLQQRHFKHHCGAAWVMTA